LNLFGSEANDDKLLNAYPELSNHIASLPGLPIFLVPEGANLLTSPHTYDPSYPDGSYKNISWQGEGDERFFAQGGSRIATGISNDLIVITGYEFIRARNFLVDFDPTSDHLMIAAKSFQGLSDASPGKINTQMQSLFKYTAADQTLQYHPPPQADSSGSDLLTIVQFNDGTNRAGFTFDPSTILIG
jgi:hypothetical protein